MSLARQMMRKKAKNLIYDNPYAKKEMKDTGLSIKEYLWWKHSGLDLDNFRAWQGSGLPLEVFKKIILESSEELQKRHAENEKEGFVEDVDNNQ